ncbi:MAG: 4'-phosphopantetheinyl transferase superfamily protein [Vampirovibrionales bacterium]|nr:4'-phosphopantetheinyl transferase superfamily protein [Vampirovibrionales bacterium]
MMSDLSWLKALQQQVRLKCHASSVLGCADLSQLPAAKLALTPDETACYQSQLLFGLKRANLWCLGRFALKQVLAHFGESLETSDVIFPHPRWSIAHTQGFAMAIGIDADGLGVGIDVEIKRPFLNQWAPFYLNKKEQSRLFEWALTPETQSDALREAWCLKEALFKATLNNKTGLDLIDFEIADNRLSAIGHNKHFACLHAQYQDYDLAFATALK